MPTLDWIGKQAVVNHHRQVPFRLLHCDPALSAGDPDAGNLLVQGDNLLALKALLPYYAGKVKCVYIDPPYNTGKERWVYNDNVNSPEIRRWLGQVVGPEAEDLCRHDKWLCMMYPRLRVAMDFLADDGVLFVSIDDNELHRLRELLDDLMRPANLLSCFVWQTEGNFDNQAKVKIAHEYILAYAKDIGRLPAPPIIDPTIPRDSKLYRPQIRNTVVKNGPGNPVSEFTLPSGFPAAFESGTIEPRQDKWPQYDEPVIVENFRVLKDVKARSGWSSKRIMVAFAANELQPVTDTKGQETRFELISTGAIEAVKTRTDTQSHVISVIRGVGTVQSASARLREMGLRFDYPKPVGLIRYLTSMVSDTNALVLDFFAGSGTTGEAVLEANASDNGNRRFILVDFDEDITTTIAQPRLSKLVAGYSDSKGNAIPALGGGFRFCKLGNPLFDADGAIAESVTFADLARHVFFTETGVPIPKQPRRDNPLLGVHAGRAVYLLFNGVLGDRRPAGGNVLTRKVLADLPPHPAEASGGGPRIIYGEACRLSPAALRAENITFRQLPYEVKTS